MKRWGSPWWWGTVAIWGSLLVMLSQGGGVLLGALLYR